MSTLLPMESVTFEKSIVVFLVLQTPTHKVYYFECKSHQILDGNSSDLSKCSACNLPVNVKKATKLLKHKVVVS